MYVQGITPFTLQRKIFIFNIQRFSAKNRANSYSVDCFLTMR